MEQLATSNKQIPQKIFARIHLHRANSMKTIKAREL
uniref:Uncharacterized protein n=1 Tax=Rhizophora mucronata TaxID=61149 RepID=A0A2P2P6H5_RHIMU